MGKKIDIQPAIELFTQRAQQFDTTVDAHELDRAIALLGRWISREHRWLTKDDMAVLGDIGATLVRASQIKQKDAQSAPQNNQQVPPMAAL